MPTKTKLQNDVFDAALGPIRPELQPWQLKQHKPGATFGFGSLVLTKEGVDCVNQLREACAQRNIAVPAAVMLVLRHYLQTQDE